MVKCEVCRLYYNKEDGLHFGLGFACSNCLRAIVNKVVVPLKKKKWIFGLFMLLFLQFAFADEMYIDPINMTAPSNSTYNYTLLGTNYFLGINCFSNCTVCNTTNTTDYNGSCEIDRTLEHGETYVRDSESCNIKASCPSCNEYIPENVTHKINFKINVSNESIDIYLEQNNQSWSTAMNSIRYIENEMTFECPKTDECEDKQYDSILPPNFSRDEYYAYCFKPIADGAMNQIEMANSFVNYTQAIATKYATCSESNKNLAQRNGKLEEQIGNIEQVKSENIKLKDNAEILNQKISNYKYELSTSDTALKKSVMFSWIWGIGFWGALFATVLTALALISSGVFFNVE